MNKALIFLLFIALAAPAEEPNQIDISLLPIKDEAEVLGKWAFPGSPFMGVAIQFDQGTYKYWFHSDVVLPDGPEYPLVGTWDLKNGVVTLKPQSRGRLYAEHWVMIRYRGEVGLFNPRDLQVIMWQETTPMHRLLQRMTAEPSVWPPFKLPAKANP